MGKQSVKTKWADWQALQVTNKVRCMHEPFRYCYPMVSDIACLDCYKTYKKGDSAQQSC